MARILIVDDSTLIRRIVADTARRVGIEVAGEAADGVDAVVQYQMLQPDLVTMDITMPRLDGLGALDRILALDPKAKVIMVSIVGQEATVVKALQMGAKDYVLKPFQVSKLAQILERHVHSRRVIHSYRMGEPPKYDNAFLAEGREYVALLGRTVKQVQDGTVSFSAAAPELTRLALNLHGTASVVGHQPVVEVAAALEQLTQQVSQGTLSPKAGLTTILADAVHTLNQILTAKTDTDAAVYAQNLTYRVETWIRYGRVELAGRTAVSRRPLIAVLLISDSGFTRKLLDSYLLQNGYRVLLAEDARSGFQTALEERPEVVILDMNALPTANRELCQRIREDPGLTQTSILVLSDRNRLDDKLEAFRSGADDYVLKPVEPEEILARLGALLRRAAPAQRPADPPSGQGPAVP